MNATNARTSAGHIRWALDGAYEYYEQGGEVYLAPANNALDIHGYRHGRWECSRTHFDRYEVLGGVHMPAQRPTSNP